MRIGVDGTCWANRRGYGRVARELCAAMVALAPEYQFVFFVDPLSARSFDLSADNLTLKTVAQGRPPTEAAAADGNRSPLDMLRLTRAVRREPLDVFFSPTVYTYFPLPPGLHAVVTVMDTIAERYPELTLPSRRARLFWRAKVKLGVWQARLILTISEFSAREISEVLGVPRQKIRVAVSAPASAFRPSESRQEIEAAAARVGLQKGSQWFLYVGGFNPHKNVDLIARAHARLTRESGDNPPRLLLVGATAGDVFHGSQGHIRRVIAEEGTEALVHWTGYIPDEELRHLHSGAMALLLPSQCEGLGLPALEAAACGAAIVATTQSPLPELLTGGGIFVEPGDEDALYAAMRRLLEQPELRREMGARGRACAREVTWARAARNAMDALREAAGVAGSAAA